MRRTIVFTVIVLLLAGWLGAAAEVDSAKKKTWMDADGERPDKAEGEVLVGYHDVDLDDSPNRAAEFESLDDSPHILLDIVGPLGDEGIVIIDATAWDSTDGDYFLRLEPSRAVRIDIGYQRFMHNLEHDPLTNLEAVNEIKVVQHTDYEPDAAYNVRYSEGKAAVHGRVQGAPGLHYSVGARVEGRKGTRQNLTSGKCFSCHTYSQTKIIDEKTQDLTAVLGYEGRNWSLMYRFMDRQYEDKGADNEQTYDNAYRPNDPNLLVFDDRIQYDEDDGPLVFGTTPDVEKQMHTLKGHWTNSAGGTLSGAFVTSKTTNEGANLDIQYQTGRLRYYHAWREGKIGLNLGYRYEDVDNDDVFVETVQNEAVMGPYAGNTYQDVYGPGGLYGGRGFVADFNRESAMSRKVHTGDVGLRFRLPHRNTLRLDYTYRQTDRDNYYVTDSGGTKSTENKVRAMLLGRPTRKVRYKVELGWAGIDDPFINLNGGCQLPAEDVYGTAGTSPSPLLPESLQYYELHDIRYADIGPIPTDTWDAKGSVTISPSPKGSITLVGRYSDEKNDNTQTTDWTREGWMAGLSFWFAPTPKFYGTFAYNHFDDEFTTPICSPLMDG